MKAPVVAWFATKGSGTNEALRMETLLRDVPGVVELPFDKQRKRASFRELWRRVGSLRPTLLVMEGTGLAGGLVCLAARLVYRIPYVVSSGDAVGPFMRAHLGPLGLAFELYERALCRWAAGFIGWTPYLCGRAMAFGTPRAMTAPGWVIGRGLAESERAACRSRWRQQLGIPDSVIVVGILGSLEWNERRSWCYGMELVRAMKFVDRNDLRVVVVGGGSGLDHLKAEAGERLGKQILLPGPVPLEEVMAAMSAFDVASLPQSLDGVGSYRYTTKLPEYAAAGLPVITNEIPVAYDLGTDWMWRLPGDGPWDQRSLKALARLIQGLTPERIAGKRGAIPALDSVFNAEDQTRRVAGFIDDLLGGEAARP